MTVPRRPRFAASRRDARSSAGPALPWAERLLHGLGAHPAFTDAVLGDLAEERARREGQAGAAAGRWWYVREALRSAPHLLWNAVHHGGPRGRARATTVVVAMALAPAVALTALLLRNGPPAHLVVERQRGGDGSDGIVLNTKHPVRLAMRVLDAEGNALRFADVRYRWAAGVPMPVTPSGVVTCTHAGDATVRAWVGSVETNVILRCRPVRQIHAGGVSLVVGGPGEDLAFMAVGPDGREVKLLAGELHVQDSSIATLKGIHVRPVAPGSTTVTARIGDAETRIRVDVYEPVRTLAGLRPDQRLVVAPVRLARGDTIRWPLPRGLFWLRYRSITDAEPMPVIVVQGPVMCMPAFGLTHDGAGCLVRGSGASIRITHPYAAAVEIMSSLTGSLKGSLGGSPRDSLRGSLRGSLQGSLALEMRETDEYPPASNHHPD